MIKTKCYITMFGKEFDITENIKHYSNFLEALENAKLFIKKGQAQGVYNIFVAGHKYYNEMIDKDLKDKWKLLREKSLEEKLFDLTIENAQLKIDIAKLKKEKQKEIPQLSLNKDEWH